MTTDEVIAQQQKKDRIEAIKGFLGCLVIIVAIVGGVVYLTRPEPDPLVKSVDIHFTISFTVTCPTPGTYRTYYEPVCATSSSMLTCDIPGPVISPYGYPSVSFQIQVEIPLAPVCGYVIQEESGQFELSSKDAELYNLLIEQ